VRVRFPVDPAFEDLCLFGDTDAGSSARFQAGCGIIWAAVPCRPGRFGADELRLAAFVRDDYVAQGAEFWVAGFPSVLEVFLNDDGRARPARGGECPARGEGAREAWERVLGPYGEALVAVD
jgi:hypothetical protein